MNNCLYIHIKDDYLKKKLLFILTTVTFISISIQKTELKILFKALTFTVIINDFNLIIKSIIMNLKNIKNYTFYKWQYITVKVKINFKLNSFFTYLNIKYTINLINYIFFYK